MDIFYKSGTMFKINTNLLSSKANNPNTINALYAAVYTEFKGANEHPTYKNLNVRDRMSELNKFAIKWLNDRKLL